MMGKSSNSFLSFLFLLFLIFLLFFWDFLVLLQFFGNNHFGSSLDLLLPVFILRCIQLLDLLSNFLLSLSNLFPGILRLQHFTVINEIVAIIYFILMRISVDKLLFLLFQFLFPFFLLFFPLLILLHSLLSFLLPIFVFFLFLFFSLLFLLVSFVLLRFPFFNALLLFSQHFNVCREILIIFKFI